MVSLHVITRAQSQLGLQNNYSDIDICDNFSNEMANIQGFRLNIKPFNGSNANPETWIKMFSIALEQAGIDNQSQNDFLYTYLEGPAENWFEGLTDAKKATFNTCHKAFLSKFKPHDSGKYHRVAEFRNRIQLPDEDVDLYLDWIKKNGQRFR